jgi:Polysaccharide pyruvyl transferase
VIVDIRGTNTSNKGARLVLEAICSRLAGQFEFSVTPGTTDRSVRDRLNLRQTLRHPIWPQFTAGMGNAVPQALRARYGWTADREIGGVLDASGFHYTDQMPTAFPLSEAWAGRAWARREIPKVILPQAFGPFDKPATRRFSREALGQADLVFVRDGVSEEHIRRLGLRTRVIRSPDFTIGMKPAPVGAISGQPFLALVPNKKVFTHGAVDRNRYVECLADFSRAAKSNGLRSILIVHEESDLPVARQLADRIDAPIFESPDPLVLKAVLGQAAAAVASRFHAVVGCVSQSVPTLAVGWSHKYRELLDDFGVPDRAVTPDTDPYAAITALLSDAAGNTRQKDRLPALLERVESMWSRTIETLTGAGS